MSEKKKKDISNPFPKGNKLWQIRQKHGPGFEKFADAQDLYDQACQYFQWSDENPIIEVEFRGAMAKRIEIPKPRPYTLRALSIYLGINKDWFNHTEKRIQEKEHKNEGDEDMILAITTIRDIIFTQKFDGAVVGLFNASIISKDLGMIDKKEIETTGNTLNLVVNKDQKDNIEGVLNDLDE